MTKVSKGRLAAVAIGAMCTMLAAGIVSNSTGYFITSVTEYLGCSRASFSIYYTIVNFCTAVMSLLMGNVIAKIGLRKTIAVSSIGVTIGFVIMSRATMLPMIYIGAAFIGIFQTFCTVTNVHIINNWYVENAGFVTGLAMSGTGWAGVIMGALMPNVVAVMDWRTGYLFCAALFLAFSVLANVLGAGEPPYEIKKEGSDQQMADDVKKNENKEYKKLLRKPLFWILMLCPLLSCVLGSGFAQHLPAHLEESNFNLVLLSIVMGVWAVGLALFKILEGFVCDKMSIEKFMIVTMLVGAVSLVAFAADSTAVLLFATVAYAWFGASITVVYPIIMRNLYGTRLASMAWGICWAAMMAGNAIGTPYYGFMYDISGSYDLGNYIGAVIILVVLIIVVYSLRKGYKQETERA